MRIRLSLVALTLIMGMMVIGCDKNTNPQKTEEEKQTEKLSKTWVLASGASAVTVTGVDVSANWVDFVLTLGNGTYQSTGADSPEVWPSGGTWAYGADLDILDRNDGVSIAITVTDTSLRMEFDYSTSGGRLNGIDGIWVFNMVPQ